MCGELLEVSMRVPMKSFPRYDTFTTSKPEHRKTTLTNKDKLSTQERKIEQNREFEQLPVQSAVWHMNTSKPEHMKTTLRGQVVQKQRLIDELNKK